MSNPSDNVPVASLREVTKIDVSGSAVNSTRIFDCQIVHFRRISKARSQRHFNPNTFLLVLNVSQLSHNSERVWATIFKLSLLESIYHTYYILGHLVFVDFPMHIQYSTSPGSVKSCNVCAENIVRLACAVLSLTPLFWRATHFAKWHTLHFKFALHTKTCYRYGPPSRFKTNSYAAATCTVPPPPTWTRKHRLRPARCATIHNCQYVYIFLTMVQNMLIYLLWCFATQKRRRRSFARTKPPPLSFRPVPRTYKVVHAPGASPVVDCMLPVHKTHHYRHIFPLNEQLRRLLVWLARRSILLYRTCDCFSLLSHLHARITAPHAHSAPHTSHWELIISWIYHSRSILSHQRPTNRLHPHVMRIPQHISHQRSTST